MPNAPDSESWIDAKLGLDSENLNFEKNCESESLRLRKPSRPQIVGVLVRHGKLSVTIRKQRNCNSRPGPIPQPEPVGAAARDDCTFSNKVPITLSDNAPYSTTYHTGVQVSHSTWLGLPVAYLQVAAKRWNHDSGNPHWRADNEFRNHNENHAIVMWNISRGWFIARCLLCPPGPTADWPGPLRLASGAANWQAAPAARGPSWPLSTAALWSSSGWLTVFPFAV